METLKKEIEHHFAKQDFTIYISERAKHTTELAKKAVDANYDVIVAAGGDGSIMEVVTGIIGSKAKLGIIPYGTGNMLALNLEIPLNINKTLDSIITGKTTKIDIGKINDHKYFAFMAGCGFDAKIIDETSREKKKKLGLLAYYIEGLKQLLKVNHSNFKIKLDNKKIIKAKALTVIIANSANIIGNSFSLAPFASMKDGLLDLIIISPKTQPEFLKLLWKLITRINTDKNNKPKYFQAKKIEIKSKPVLLVQADGDIIGKTPVKIQVLPEAIEVIVP